MKNHIETILEQYDALMFFFQNQEHILKSKRGFQRRFDRFHVKKSVIAVTVAHLEIVSGENERVNSRLRKTLCELAESIVNIITHSGMTGYYSQGGFSSDVLEQMNDKQLIGYCTGIFELLQEHPDTFIRQGIVKQVRSSFKDAIDVFEKRVAYPTVRESLISHFEQLLEKLFADMETILRADMDLYIYRLRLTKPLLVRNYKIIRKEMENNQIVKPVARK